MSDNHLKIAFHENSLTIRGSTVALTDYCHYNETLLGNKSIIVVPKSSIEEGKNDQIAVENIQKHFDVFFYVDMNDLERILEEQNCDILYVIKYGNNDGVCSKLVKTVVHCVFAMHEPHGNVYAGVSSQIAEKHGKTLYVPHLIGLKPSTTGENLRKDLGIPENANVFGYMGGNDSFNIVFAIETVKRAVRVLDNVFFVFVNIPRFDVHPNIIFLNKIVDLDEKNKFIMTCDAVVEAQRLGQSFGLTLGEFSVNNKPIIVYSGIVLNDNYRRILGDNALYYWDEDSLMNILANFNKNDYIGKDLNCYKDFTPENVMKKFKDVFIDETIKELN